MLQLAAVIGPVFTPGELLALSDMGAEPTKRALRFLTQRIGLVRAADTGDGYTFYHGLIRDYVRQRHETDDPVDYRETNRLRGDYLAAHAAERLDWYEGVAFHYHEAAAHEEALVYALEAADAARGIGAVAEAVRFLGWAVEHADRGGFVQESVTGRRRLGALQQELIRTDDAVVTLEEAVARRGAARLSGTDEFELIVELARAHRMEEDWDRARAGLAQADRLAGSVDSDHRAYLRLVEAEVYLSGAPRDVGAAESLLRQAARLTSTPRHLAGIYGHMGFVALAEDQPVEAWDWFERAHRLAVDSGSAGRCTRLTCGGRSTTSPACGWPTHSTNSTRWRSWPADAASGRPWPTTTATPVAGSPSPANPPRPQPPTRRTSATCWTTRRGQAGR